MSNGHRFYEVVDRNLRAEDDRKAKALPPLSGGISPSGVAMLLQPTKEVSLAGTPILARPPGIMGP